MLAVAIAGGLAALTALSLPLYLGLVTRQAVAAAADAAALAAADAASGRIPGYPCELASRVAAANGAAVGSCTVDGLVVTITASRSILGIAVSARATAGPPTSGLD